MDLKDNLCLVCRKYPSIDSTGVCSTCYNKMKRMNIHDYQWHRENDCFEGIVTEEEIEQHIFREMKKEQEDWAHWHNSVDAIDVYIAILDNVSTEILINNPIDIGRSWHKRQVSFVKDVLLKVDKSFFHYTEPMQVKEFVNAAVEYWTDNSSIQRAKDILNSIRLSHSSSSSIVFKTFGFEPLKHEEYIFYLMIKEEFDWEWCSWFEVMYGNIYKSLDDSLWIELYNKHFSNEIIEWIEQK